MAKQRGYEIVSEYTDVISGAKSKRPGLDQLLADARRRAPLDIDRAQVVADRLAGMSLTSVAKKYRVSRSTVCRRVNEAGGLKKPSVPQLRKEERVVPSTDSSNLPSAA
jgi:DNA invertase Pin-like site-specific DNA recombinase